MRRRRFQVPEAYWNWSRTHTHKTLYVGRLLFPLLLRYTLHIVTLQQQQQQWRIEKNSASKCLMLALLSWHVETILFLLYFEAICPHHSSWWWPAQKRRHCILCEQEKKTMRRMWTRLSEAALARSKQFTLFHRKRESSDEKKRRRTSMRSDPVPSISFAFIEYVRWRWKEEMRKMRMDMLK